MNEIIKINHLSFEYTNIPVLKNINFKIEKGSFTAILGANGCGKTTLLKAILRLVKIQPNTVFINKCDALELKRNKIAQIVSYVPQNERVPYHFSVREFIELGRYSKQTSKEEDDKVVDKMIKVTHINYLQDKYIGEISGGEYQRCIIARALCQEASIMLLDEPISALDPLHQKEIMNLLKTLVEKENLSIVCTLHSINSALDYCSDSILMKEGNIIYKGKTADILNKVSLKEAYNISASLVANPYTNNKHFIIEPYNEES
jgi:iron complex transport system ATP-binding protein